MAVKKFPPTTIGESGSCNIMFLIFSPKSVPLGVVARPSLLLYGARTGAFSPVSPLAASHLLQEDLQELNTEYNGLKCSI